MKNVPVLQIDTAVPLPSDSRPTRQQIPVHQLEPGESILFPSNKRQAVANMATRLKQAEGKVFVVKKMDDKHHRVWRVE